MNKIQTILINEQFKFVGIDKWYKRAFYYIVDRKNRTKIRISKWLKNNLEQSTELVPLAISLRSKSKTHFQEETIINILKWVRKNIKYKSDKLNWDNVEYWASAKETVDRGFDDCDGMNGLIYVLARYAGIGADQLYCMIGKVSVGGHFWLTFWSTEYDKLVGIDSTYYPTNRRINHRPKFKLNEKYLDIWYAFNENITLKM